MELLMVAGLVLIVSVVLFQSSRETFMVAKLRNSADQSITSLYAEPISGASVLVDEPSEEPAQTYEA